MRILAGEFKGRKISVFQGTRPVSTRVRKSCFDILKQDITDKRVLDLFAGSGSLGIEALSRGARDCLFVDWQKSCLRVLKKNLLSLGIEKKARICLKDAYFALREIFSRKILFDIIFLDPPYHKGMLIKTLQALEEYDILAPSGYIVAFCYFKDDFKAESGKFLLMVNRKYGQTIVAIYKKISI